MFLFALKDLSYQDSRRLYPEGIVRYGPPDTGIQRPTAARWSPGVAYAEGSQVLLAGYVWYRLKPKISDPVDGGIPVFNFVGRTPSFGEDPTQQVGMNTWMRMVPDSSMSFIMPDVGRYHQFTVPEGKVLGLNILSAAATYAEGQHQASFIVTGLRAVNSGTTETPASLLMGLQSGVGFSLINVAATTLNATKKYKGSSAWLNNYELPKGDRAYIYTSDNYYSMSIGALGFGLMAGGPDVGMILLNHALVGRPMYIGKTQLPNAKIAPRDYGRTEYDEWGSLIQEKRKVARKISRTVLLRPVGGETIRDRVELVRNILLTYADKYVCVVFKNDGVVANEQVCEISSDDVVVGKIMKATISKISGETATLDITIQSTPTGTD